MELLKFKETAGILGISVRTLREMVFKGKIAHYRIGGLIKFRKDDVLQWIELNRVEQKPVE